MFSEGGLCDQVAWREALMRRMLLTALGAPTKDEAGFITIILSASVAP